MPGRVALIASRAIAFLRPLLRVEGVRALRISTTGIDLIRNRIATFEGLHPAERASGLYCRKPPDKTECVQESSLVRTMSATVITGKSAP